MNNILKQRLVGALILVALGVVFWPIIFVEPEEHSSLDNRIPPRPDVDTTPIQSPDRRGLKPSPSLPVDDGISDDNKRPEQRAQEALSENTNNEVAPEPAPDVVVASEPDNSDPDNGKGTALNHQGQIREQAPLKPEVDDQGVPVAWMLQVISVTQKDSAERTRQALTDMGHKAYVKGASVNGKTVYRVYVGPKFERAKIEAIQAEIDGQLGVKSMVRRYLP
ncbi:MAG: SPOR domain-containing protein [Parahaliea sp.]